jgi:hypothetical protein
MVNHFSENKTDPNTGKYMRVITTEGKNLGIQNINDIYAPSQLTEMIAMYIRIRIVEQALIECLKFVTSNDLSIPNFILESRIETEWQEGLKKDLSGVVFPPPNQVTNILLSKNDERVKGGNICTNPDLCDQIRTETNTNLFIPK